MKTCNRIGFVLAGYFLAAAPAFAQAPTDDRVKELMRLALVANQGPLVADAAGQQQTIDLKLSDAVAIAAEKNLEIGIEQLNPQTVDLSIAALRTFYRPTITSRFSSQMAELTPSTQLIGSAGATSNTLDYNGGLTQNLRWGGASLGMSFNNRRQEGSNRLNSFNPQYAPTLAFNFTQPLLRNFKTDTTRASLSTTLISRDIAELQVQARIASTLAAVRNAYWDLVYTIRSVEAARRSLSLADKLVEDNRARVEIGTLAPIDIVQSQAEAATRRQTLTAAEAAQRTAELTLKRLLVTGTDDPLWRATINPVDRPTFESQALDLEGAIRNALANRTDVAQTKKTLESNEINMRLLVNQTLPALDLTANYSTVGIGGNRLETNEDILGAPVTNTVPGGYFDALKVLGKNQYPTWTLALNLSYPIGFTQADANQARAKIQVQQTLKQVKAIELQVATEVTAIALNIESTVKRIAAAQASRELSQKRVEAQQSKFEVGMATIFEVVQAQRDLFDAEAAELRAILDYQKSLVDFERVQLTGTSATVTAIR